MLCRAAEKLRGVPELAAALAVSEATLRRWMRGESKPPDAVLQASIKIFVDGARPPLPKLGFTQKRRGGVADI